ncbi:hypothetical protein [Euzebya sp.]|uniref:hypothetical protein n=1 Tax=Euzebya sp. TaxID=1971409 RepID=UPI003517360E
MADTRAGLPPELADAGRAPTTTAAGLGTVGLSLAFALWTFLTLQTGVEDETLVATGIGLDASGTVATILAVVQWLLCLPHLFAGALLLRRSPSAFGAATFILGTYGVVALLLAGGPTLGGDPGPNAIWGIGAGLANLVVLGLVVHPATRRDLELTQMRRDWVRSRG